MSSTHWQLANGQACPDNWKMYSHVKATGKWTGTGIGNQIMDRHVQATGKWTGMSRQLANGQACPGNWQMDRHVHQALETIKWTGISRVYW